MLSDKERQVVECFAAERSALAESAQVPELTVWYGSMPETNGKSNWTAMLHRKGETGFQSYTFARSEYPDRVRYDADCMRYLIGEIDVRPSILSYDPNKHSGYVEPVKAAQVPVMGDAVARLMVWRGPRHHDIPHGGLVARTYQEFPKGAGECGGYWHECGRELFEKPTTSITQAELDALRKDAERYRAIRMVGVAFDEIVAFGPSVDSAVDAYLAKERRS